MSPPSSTSSFQRERNGAKFRTKAKEDDLVLFNEILMKENDGFLLCSADELEDSLSKLKYFPDFRSNLSADGSSSDLLNEDCEKNDYEWLLTPPETPLFPSLDDENTTVANPKKLSTSNPRASTPPVHRSSSITARKAGRGSSPTPKLQKSQPKSFPDRPPSRTRGFSPVRRRNSLSPTGSISFSSSHCQDQDSSSNHSKSSIISSGDGKIERFSDAVPLRSEDHHETAEDIFRTIMSSIPGRTLSGEEGRTDIHHSMSSMNASIITSSDESSNDMDGRSEKKMQDIDDRDSSSNHCKSSIISSGDEKNECFSDAVRNRSEDHHGTSEDIFRTIMPSIPGRTLSGEEGGTDVHRSPSSMNASTITSSDGSSNGTDGRSGKMQDIDDHRDMLQFDVMEWVAVNEDETNTYKGDEIHDEEFEVVASVDFSHVSSILEAPILSENSQKIEIADGGVDLLQVHDGKDRNTSDFQPHQANVDESCERYDADTSSSEEVASEVSTLIIEEKPSPLSQIKYGLDEFSTFSMIGSHHRRAHSFSTYTRTNDPQGVSFLKRSNSDKGSLFVTIAPMEKPFSRTVDLNSVQQSKGSPKSQFHVDRSSNSSGADVESLPELSSLKPRGTLDNRIDNSLENSLDDERFSSPVNPGDASHDDDDFISLPVESEASPSLSSTSGSSIVLLELMKGESGKKTKCLTLEEATDTILFCSSIVHDLAFQASTIATEKEAAQSEEKSTSEKNVKSKSTHDEKSTPEMNGKIQKISPLIDDPPEKAGGKKPLKGESPKMCSCTVM